LYYSFLGMSGCTMPEDTGRILKRHGTTEAEHTEKEMPYY
jgi:hypothetical protein